VQRCEDSYVLIDKLFGQSDEGFTVWKMVQIDRVGMIPGSLDNLRGKRFHPWKDEKDAHCQSPIVNAVALERA